MPSRTPSNVSALVGESSGAPPGLPASVVKYEAEAGLSGCFLGERSWDSWLSHP